MASSTASVEKKTEDPAFRVQSLDEKRQDPVSGAAQEILFPASAEGKGTPADIRGRAQRSVEGDAHVDVASVAESSFSIPVESSNLPRRPEVVSLMEFLATSPTASHAGLSAKKLLVDGAGFTELKENEPWTIVPGGKYFIARDLSSFITFVMPREKPASACILGAHTDSPGMKLKPSPEKTVDNATLLCPEVYGGPIVSSWFDRSLGLAGRITYLDESGEAKSSLIDLQKTIGTISHVAIHLDRELGTKHEVNRQEHLPAICWIHEEEGKSPSHFEEELKKVLPFTKLLGHELFLVPREPAEIVNSHLIHAARLDNLLGTHASLFALLSSQEPEESQVKMVVCWDHEEVGSSSYKGAASNFLDSVLTRIAEETKMTAGELLAMKANSGLISIDVAHGRHPNYFGKHEPSHAPLLGKGPVVKYHANQSYATSPASDWWIYKAALDCGVSVQKFCIRSDGQCGSTIGNIAAPRLGIRTVDIGAPVLGMHSIREKGHLADHVSMCLLLKTLLSMNLNIQ